MVEATPPAMEEQKQIDPEDMTDDQFEAMCASMPRMTEEEKERELDEW